MSDERDELKAHIHDSAVPVNGRYVLTDDSVADAILAAGYSKHSEELAGAKRAAKTLGEIIEKQCRDVLEVTGLHHLINEDGDGHWDVVWMRLFEMREELKDLKESTIARERKRGDAWRDRAQSLEVELQAAKPWQVTTVEELDALPVGSVLIDRFGTVWRVANEVTDGTEGRYEGTSGNVYFTTGVFAPLMGPFAILHIGAPA